ncbi:MAG TPA: metallophosphoesterase [Cyclobacteriaceae bacterium]|nr:metallophosphoesterase [Cyclobacteriaceae bacterium]
MKRNPLIYLGLLLSILSGIYNFQEYKKESPFYFFHLSDPQFGFLDANKSVDQEIALYENAVAHINRLEPDFVVITGDFVHNNEDASQWAEFNRITRMIKSSIPVYLVPGNHEYSQQPTEREFVEYKKTYGDDKFSVTHKNSLLLGINSTLINSEFHALEKEQFDWLESQLKNAGKVKHIFLFTHHPFFVESAEEPDKYSNIVLEKRRKYLDLLEKYKVRAVFNGHLHRNSHLKYKGTDMIASSAVGKQLGKDLSGLRVIKVSKGGFTSDYYGLEDLDNVELER